MRFNSKKKSIFASIILCVPAHIELDLISDQVKHVSAGSQSEDDLDDSSVSEYLLYLESTACNTHYLLRVWLLFSIFKTHYGVSELNKRQFVFLLKNMCLLVNRTVFVVHQVPHQSMILMNKNSLNRHIS